MQATAPATVRLRREEEIVEGEGVFTEAQAADLFEKTARRYLSMSGAEFLRKWDAQQFVEPETRARAMRVAALIPLIRNISVGKKAR